MSAHKCPNCREFGFIWKNDDEISPLTIWDCFECGYRAFEDEALEAPCPDCQYKYRVQLEDETFRYCWCSECEAKTII